METEQLKNVVVSTVCFERSFSLIGLRLGWLSHGEGRFKSDISNRSFRFLI
jgi:hypothetical protein